MSFTWPPFWLRLRNAFLRERKEGRDGAEQAGRGAAPPSPELNLIQVIRTTIHKAPQGSGHKITQPCHKKFLCSIYALETQGAKENNVFNYQPEF